MGVPISAARHIPCCPVRTRCFLDREKTPMFKLDGWNYFAAAQLRMAIAVSFTGRLAWRVGDTTAFAIFFASALRPREMASAPCRLGLAAISASLVASDPEIAFTFVLYSVCYCMAIERPTRPAAGVPAREPVPVHRQEDRSLPGYGVDHVLPLKRCGAGYPSNRRSQSAEDARAKDRWED